MNRMRFLLLAVCLFASAGSLWGVDLRSIYTERPNDPEAFYFTAENYNIKADGRTDVTAELQRAINQVKTEKNFGILYIPEGRYLISNTIYVPAAVRLIGYGAKRPEFVLAPNSPGYDKEVPTDKGKAKYMFWYTGALYSGEGPVRDAGAGTFYSCFSNINLRIGDGNPHAVALRTHYAQHSFVSHVAVWAGKGKAGLFEIGNEMENVAFYGGDYGIYTTKTSPGWPVVMVDSYFEGQRVAALRCQESGLAMVNIQVKNVPVVFDIDPNYADRLYVENSRFENVREAIVVVSNENNSNNQITFRDVVCSNVPVVARYSRSGTRTMADGGKNYMIKEYAHGLVMPNIAADPEYRTSLEIEPLKRLPAVLVRDIPAIAPMSEWVNVRELGAKGDDVTDDTAVIQAALDKYDVVYVPQGWYRISKTLKMRPGTQLIGLHPYATQFRLAESSPAFSGFGAAVIASIRHGTAVLFQPFNLHTMKRVRCDSDIGVAKCYTMCMTTTISQRELRNNSADIMRRLQAGELFTLTRNGTVVGSLTPAVQPTRLPITRPATKQELSDFPLHAVGNRPLSTILDELRDDRV